MKMMLGNGVVDIRHIELAIRIDEHEVDLHLISGRVERVACACPDADMIKLHTDKSVDEFLKYIHELEASQREADSINFKSFMNRLFAIKGGS